MFGDLRTSTKLFLLCSMLAGAIILATHGLIEEKQITIGFLRKELAGTQYLNALRGVYAAILADPSQGARPASFGGCCIRGSLPKAEAESGNSLHTATLAQCPPPPPSAN